ncbi:MAG: phenylalanine-4-hydroxylase [Rhodothermales bacterium]|jgi:phenylalanine-4-hydroxylase
MDAVVEPDLRSAYERAADRGVDPRCVPQGLDENPPIGQDIVPPEYSTLEHDNWRFLFDTQIQLLPGRAGQAFMKGVETLGMTPDQIPRLADLSARMENAAGWSIARIPGLLHERDFFNLLSERIFPSTDYIRGVDELDYTPAPDCFHDIFGHMPMLTEPAFADFYQLFGQAALAAKGADRVRLERLHWFAVEFGLVKQNVGTRIFGAGILSSRNEVIHALSDDVQRIPFDVAKVVEQDYQVWHLQPILFVLESFDQLVDGFRSWTHERGLT